MRNPASLAEPLILDALREEGGRRSLARVLLIGMQSSATVMAANEMLGADRVDLLHLDRSAGAVGCGLGNAEQYIGLDGGAGGADLDHAPRYTVVALNVAAAKSYRLLRDIVSGTAQLVAEDGCVLVAGPRKGGAEVAATVLEDLFESVETVAYRKGERIYRAVRPSKTGHPQPLRGANLPQAASSPGSSPDILPRAGETRDGLPSPAYADVGEADRCAAQRGAEWLGLPGGDAAAFETVELRGRTLRLQLDDRIFARGRLDPATRMLAEAFEVRPGAAVLDLGAGSGLLGIVAALLEPTCQVTLVDSDPIAVEVSRQNAVLNGASNVSAHLSDLLRDLPGQTFDLVVMNPPFHRGRQHDTSLGERFLTEASAALRPGGAIFVVCNRFLRYEPTIERLVGPVREVAGDRQFKVLTAQRAVTRTHRAPGGSPDRVETVRRNTGKGRRTVRR